jgi:hypothetical protein
MIKGYLCNTFSEAITVEEAEKSYAEKGTFFEINDGRIGIWGREYNA